MACSQKGRRRTDAEQAASDDLYSSSQSKTTTTTQTSCYRCLAVSTAVGQWRSLKFSTHETFSIPAWQPSARLLWKRKHSNTCTSAGLFTQTIVHSRLVVSNALSSRKNNIEGKRVAMSHWETFRSVASESRRVFLSPSRFNNRTVLNEWKFFTVAHHWPAEPSIWFLVSISSDSRENRNFWYFKLDFCLCCSRQLKRIETLFTQMLAFCVVANFVWLIMAGVPRVTQFQTFDCRHRRRVLFDAVASIHPRRTSICVTPEFDNFRKRVTCAQKRAWKLPSQGYWKVLCFVIAHWLSREAQHRSIEVCLFPSSALISAW